MTAGKTLTWIIGVKTLWECQEVEMKALVWLEIQICGKVKDYNKLYYTLPLVSSVLDRPIPTSKKTQNPKPKTGRINYKTQNTKKKKQDLSAFLHSSSRSRWGLGHFSGRDLRQGRLLQRQTSTWAEAGGAEHRGVEPEGFGLGTCYETSGSPVKTERSKECGSLDIELFNKTIWIRDWFLLKELIQKRLFSRRRPRSPIARRSCCSSQESHRSGSLQRGRCTVARCRHKRLELGWGCRREEGLCHLQREGNPTFCYFCKRP